MTFSVRFDQPTYDAKTRTIYDSLERAIQASEGMTAHQLLAELENYPRGRSERFIGIEIGVVDLKEEITKDLKDLGLDLETLSNDDFMRVDGVIEDIFSEGWGAEISIADLAKRVMEQLEA